MSKLLPLCLVSALALAADPGVVSRGDLLKQHQYKSFGNYALFVDPTGNDANACTSTGTAACLTIQGAINKLPKLLLYRASVTVAAGNYAGYYVSGFTADYGTQTTTAGIIIDGTLANSTLATGTATGTASAGSAGSTSTFGTLTDGTQTWTVNDLVGRFVNILTGTGALQVKVIVSNTATVLTVAGTWTAPTGTSTYAIQDASTFITTCIAAPPTAGGTTAAVNTAIRIQGNAAGMTVTNRGISVNAACSFGVYSPDTSSVIVNRMQFPSSTTATKMTFGGPVMVQDVYSTFSSTSGTHIVAGPLASTQAAQVGGVGNIAGPSLVRGTVQNSMFVNGLTGVNLSNFQSTTVLGLQLNSIDGTAIALGGVISNLQGLNVDCTATATAVGIGIINNFTSAVSPDHIVVTDCNTMFKATGPASFFLSLNAVSSTGVTTGIDVRYGGIFTFTQVPTGTYSGNEISLDNGAITSTFAAINSASCLMSLSTGSRVCKD